MLFIPFRELTPSTSRRNSATARPRWWWSMSTTTGQAFGPTRSPSTANERYFRLMQHERSQFLGRPPHEVANRSVTAARYRRARGVGRTLCNYLACRRRLRMGTSSSAMRPVEGCRLSGALSFVIPRYWAGSSRWGCDSHHRRDGAEEDEEPGVTR